MGDGNAARAEQNLNDAAQHGKDRARQADPEL
jgi:hypothetical protein